MINYRNKKLRTVSIVRNELRKRNALLEPRNEQSVCSQLPFKSHIKIVTPLDKFIVGKVVTLGVTGLSWGQTARKLELISRSSAQSTYERFKRSMSFAAKKQTGTHENC